MRGAVRCKDTLKKNRARLHTQVIKATECNNEGALTFTYSLEDTDQVGSANVYNGQYSVLWCNVRDGFKSELAAMYQQLRTMVDPNGTAGSPFSYAKIAQRFTDHQGVWPEAIWNEDAFIKYLQPFLLANENYLAMLQGNKASQRDWWLFNRFRYLDSKYKCGDAQSNFITLRCYAVGNITLTPYADIYARIKYGSDEGEYGVDDVSRRVARNNSIEMVCGLDQMIDTEVYIYSSDRISSVGDLSPLQVGLANFSMAPKLQSIKLGDEDPTYENMRLGAAESTFYVGSNDLLETVNIANCKALGTGVQQSVDLSMCRSLKTVIATGTKLSGIILPDGGHLETLKLPETLSNFTIMNHHNLETLYFEGYGSLETLRCENSDNIPIADLILENPNLNRVRIVGMNWECESAEDLSDIYDILMTCSGMDANGSNTPKAVVSGIVTVEESIPSSLLDNFTENFPDLTVVAGGSATLTVRFRDWDGTVLDTQTCGINGSVLDPVTSGRIQTPVRPDDLHSFYTYSGWDKPLTNITTNLIVTAVYNEEIGCVVTFVNDDLNHTVLYQTMVHSGDTVTDPVTAGLISTPTKASDSQYSYVYLGWQSSLINITSDREIVARYQAIEAICISFRNWDGTVLINKYIAPGEGVADPVTSGDIQAPTKPDDTVNQKLFSFGGWDKSLNAFVENTIVTATFTESPYYLVIFKQPAEAGGATLFELHVSPGASLTDPVVSGAISTPAREPESTYNYIYKGWDASMSQNVRANLTYTAQYKTDQQFIVTFIDWDNTVLDTQTVYDEDNAVEPVAAGRIPQPARAQTPQYSYTYTGWTGNYTNVKADVTITATYTATARTYCVRFYNGDSLLQTLNVLYGATATYTGSAPSHDDPDNWEFTGWSPSNENIIADTDCYAVWLFTGVMTRKLISRSISGTYENSNFDIIGSYAFAYCGDLTFASFPNAITIEEYAFVWCSHISTVIFPSAENIKGHAFELCGLITAEFPVAKNIGTWAFNGCNIVSISFPNAERIEPMAFAQCRSLVAAYIPNAKFIGGSAFASCNYLLSVVVGINHSSICVLENSRAFSGTNTAITIYVPDSFVTDYQTAANWSYFSSRIKGISEYSVI